jgi:hypothetical protein
MGLTARGHFARAGRWAPKGGVLKWTVITFLLPGTVRGVDGTRDSDTPAKDAERCVIVDDAPGLLAAIEQGAQDICMRVPRYALHKPTSQQPLLPVLEVG